MTFATNPIDALRTVSTLLIIPSVNNKGNTMFIARLVSEISVREVSHNLRVNVVRDRHSLSPDFRTVSLMSSMARKETFHSFSKYFSTYTSQIKIVMYINLRTSIDAVKQHHKSTLRIKKPQKGHRTCIHYIHLKWRFCTCFLFFSTFKLQQEVQMR